MSQFAQQLRELRRLPEPALASDPFVARVMAACSDAAPEPVSRRSTVYWLGMTTLLAAAAALLLVRHEASPPQPRAEVVAARGMPPTEIRATVQAFVGRGEPGRAPALLDGAELGPGDGILIRYSNPGERRVFLMVFALDAQREVHWLHPAYLDAASNPSSLELRPGVTAETLDEVAEPENPAPGLLGVYALLSEQPFAVKAVEARISARQAPVHELFPEAEVEQWRCTWRAR